MGKRTIAWMGASLFWAGAAAAVCAAAGSQEARWPFWSPLTLESTRWFGEYAVRVWRAPEESALGGAVTIERDGQPVVVIGDAGLHAMTGTDIDASGWPNVIVETYSGGAHCCFATRVFDLGERLVEIHLPPSPGGNAAADFVDLDGDGIWEVVSVDDSFAYAYCAYAGSPAVPVALALDTSCLQYVPASFRYPELYWAAIGRDAERAAASDGVDPGWDGTSKCEVLPLVLDYLYMGDRDAARQALETYYVAVDRDAFWAEILATTSASPYYASRP
jgi:hypothetical protein